MMAKLTTSTNNTFAYEITSKDNSSLILQKTETLNNTTITYDYTYDDNSRLINVKKDNVEVESYSYDSNGNRTSATINTITTTASYTLDDQVEVYGDNTYTYNDDGYLSSKVTPNGTTTYTYSSLGELKQVILPSKTITYKHNANNQRVAKLIDGIIQEKYLWADLITLLAVYDKDDNLIQRFTYANGRMPISMTQGSNKYYLHYDQVGSLRAISDTNHNIIKEIIYDSYGNIISDTNPDFKVPFGFAGGLLDQDTKLTRFGYRDYDSYTGKWTAKDPIDFSGGDTNLYGYVLNDPVNGVDPEGLKGLFDTAVEQLTGYSISNGLEKTGMNKAMSNILAEGIAASAFTLLSGGVHSIPASVLMFGFGLVEGTILESTGLGDKIDENIEDILYGNKENGCKQ